MYGLSGRHSVPRQLVSSQLGQRDQGSALPATALPLAPWDGLHGLWSWTCHRHCTATRRCLCLDAKRVMTRIRTWRTGWADCQW